ncbi:MAG: hypothetical protein OXU22_00580, partial [Gammaproteobacteria bacterium]|nr:hypothetical protein [Gammaproteobacteria bacterium]
ATRFLDVTVDNANRDEGDNRTAIFTVTLTGEDHDTGAPAQTVDWCITGTAESNDFSATGAGAADCSGVSGTVLAMGRLDFGTSFGGTTAPAHTGGLTRTVRTTIATDSLNEASETLTLTLSNIQGGSCPIMPGADCQPPTVSNTESATVTIAASDDITYSIASPSNSDESAAVTFAVNLSAASEGDITVAYTIDSATGTATGGAATLMTRDYTTPDPLTVMIPAGSTTAQLEIAVNDDDLNEADETIIVELSDETAATFDKADEAGAVTRSATATDQTQTATIRDNDAITISVARTSPSGNDEVEEGTAVTFTVTMAGAAGGSAGTVSIPWTARMDNQAPRPDETDSNSMTVPDLTTMATTTTNTGVTLGGTLTIATGDTTGAVTITAAADGIGELDERFTFTLGSPTNTDTGGRVSNGSPTSVTVGINENIAALHVVTVSVSSTVAEDNATPPDPDDGTATGGGQITYTFGLETPAVTDDNARTAALTATFSLTGTALSDTDYTEPTWAITFPCTAVSSTDSRCQAAGNADITRTIDITPDRIDDDAETIILTLTGVTDGDNETMFPGTAAAAASRTVTITDNDEAGLNFSIADDAMLEVLDGNANTYTVALTSQPAAGSVTITPTVTAVTSTADPSTVTLDMQALTFTTANWNTAQTVEVQTDDLGVIADTDFRIDYTVTANAEAPAYSKTTVPGGVAVRIKAAVNLLSEPRTGGINAGISMGNPAIEVAGQTATYPIVLGQMPTADVTIAFTIGVPTPPTTTGDHAVNEDRAVTQDADEMPRIVSGASLTFTSANWDTAQNVVVAISEQVRGAYELRAAVTSTDANYASVGTRTLHIRVVPPVNRAVDTVNRVILPEVARAMADLQMSAVGNRLHRFRSGGGGAQLNLGGQSTLAGMAAANIQSMAKDGIDWKRMLADSSFHMPFSGGGGDGVGGGAFWGGGAYHSIGGDSDGVDWEGNIVGGHLGFDARVGGSALAGLLVSYNDVEIEDYTYNDTSLTGSPEITGDWLLDMTSVSPYLGWRRGALEGWAMAGYGEGELEIDERGHASRDGRSLETDVSMHTFGLGVSRSVERRRGREVRIKAEAFATRAEVDDGDDVTGHREAPISDLEVDANRVRLMLEFSGTRQLRGGADFGTSAEFGMRYDGGDGRTGGGSELGLGFHYHGAGGVSLQGRVRGLFGHSADWGASGSLKLQPGGDGQGLSLAVSPAYGRTAGGAQGVWNNGLFASDDSGDGVDLRARMEVEAGWGVKAFTDTGLLTPYSNMTFTDTGARTVSLGVEWQTSLGNGAGPGSRRGGVDFGLNLSAKRTNADDKAPEDAVVLKGTLRF